MEGLTIADRTLVTKGSKRGVLSVLHLEEVRDYLRKLAEKQEATDFERTLNQLHVSFANGKMIGQFMTPRGLDPDAMLFSDHGASQVASEVLPSRFFTGLKTLAGLDHHGEKLATMTWAKFAQSHAEPPVRMVRTVKMKVDDDVRRVIRSCHSQGYAAYSNLDFVEDLLTNAGDFAQLPVLDWRVTDSGMRMRFAGDQVERLEVNKPITMVEAWNSEVGRRRVGLRGGQFVLKCTNGMGHWSDKTEYNWIHRGNSDRIRRGVQQAFENLQTTARGVVEAYTDALNIEIDNAFAWMEAELDGRVSDRVMRSAQAALNHPTTTPGGLLASVVDAITLVAQDEIDMFQQYEVERVASQLLSKGRGQAMRHNGRILVEA
jgi:hypothetical protein